MGETSAAEPGSHHAMVASLNGFDPLGDLAPAGSELHELYERSVKSEVMNIIRSYTGTLDCFSEALQNAIDAVEKRAALAANESSDYRPKLWLKIDLRNWIVTIIDNGIGMSLEEFKYCLRPSVSFKQSSGSRGHKGVGATFLAYGFQSLRLGCKRPGEAHSVVLRGGRQWVDDESGRVRKPVFEVEEFNCPELTSEVSGTCVEINIARDGNQRPNFAWLGITEPEQWLKVLRLKTPLGGVYLEKPNVEPEVIITVRDTEGVDHQLPSNDNAFLWPHQFSSVPKTEDIDTLKVAWNKTQGTKIQRQSAMPAKYKNLDCIWQVWNKDDLINENWGLVGDDDEDLRQTIERHSVGIYGCFMRSKTV